MALSVIPLHFKLLSHSATFQVSPLAPLSSLLRGSRYNRAAREQTTSSTTMADEETCRDDTYTCGD